LNSSVRFILLILVAGIGDFVMATKAIRVVRKGYPDAELHVLTSSAGAAIAQGHPGVDRVWAFPIRELRTHRLRFGPVIRLIRQLRETRYDIVANLYPVGSWSGSARMGLLLSCLKARVKIGQAIGPMRFWLDQRLPPNEFVGKHRVDAMADVAVAIGGKPDGGGLELSCRTGCSGKWDAFLAPAGSSPPWPVIGLNPGGDRPNRRWAPEKFAAAAKALAGRCGASILIFGGPGEEQIGQKIKDVLGGAVLNLAGRLSLPDLAVFLSRCDLLITNDSGPMHMAAALRTPVVALFGPENEGYFRPYTSPNLCRVIQKPVACRPCSQTTCRTGLCLDAISPAEVVERSLELLNENRLPGGQLHSEHPQIARACCGKLPEPENHVRHLRPNQS
jgi:ADP-heptose:LPS heptosyltransferase